MNLTPMLAADLSSLFANGKVAFVVVVILFVIFMGLVTWLSRYTKVGPNQVLVVSGKKHSIIQPDGTTAVRAASASSKAAARLFIP